MINFQKYRLKKFCFFFELSTGGKYIGAFGVAFNIYILTTMSVSIYRLAEEIYNGSPISKYILVFAVLGFILFFIDFIICILLIKASIVGHRKFIKPYLTISKVWILLYGLMALMRLETIIVFIIRIYCFLNIYSLYWSLAEKKDKNQLSVVEEAEESAQVTGTQEAQNT